MFSRAGITQAGRTLWEKRLGRTFRKNKGLGRKIASNFVRREVATPSGFYLGHRIALRFDEGRFDRVVRKIVRRLYYFEYENALPATVDVTTLWLNKEARVEAGVQYAHQLDWGKRQWPGIFEYRCANLPGTPQGSMWLMRFYGNTHFWAISKSSDTIGDTAG